MNQVQENLIHISETGLSDAFKDAHGVRPRGIYKEWWTESELEIEFKHLSMICEDNRLHETKLEAEALVRFELLIKRTIKYGAADRETAIKWLVDGEDLQWCEYDLQYFFWKHGLSYEIQNKWAKALTN